MRKITITCLNEGFCNNYGIKHEIDAYKGYMAKEHRCTGCLSTMVMEITDDGQAVDHKTAESKQEEGPETARNG